MNFRNQLYLLMPEKQAIISQPHQNHSLLLCLNSQAPHNL